MFYITILLVCQLPPQCSSLKGELPPQVSVCKECDKNVKPKKKDKSCSCSTSCACGCNEGLPCRCNDVPVIYPQPTIQTATLPVATIPTYKAPTYIPTPTPTYTPTPTHTPIYTPTYTAPTYAPAMTQRQQILNYGATPRWVAPSRGRSSGC